MWAAAGGHIEVVSALVHICELIRFLWLLVAQSGRCMGARSLWSFCIALGSDFWSSWCGNSFVPFPRTHSLLATRSFRPNTCRCCQEIGKQRSVECAWRILARLSRELRFYIARMSQLYLFIECLTASITITPFGVFFNWCSSSVS